MNCRKYVNFLLAFLLSINTFAQKNIKPTTTSTKPKIVIGIVIDQMRWDYLNRYKSTFAEGGFKRLMQNGYNFNNTFLPYIPTYTAVGHTCIYTGAVPATSGIIGNNWYEKSISKNMYCTDDSTVQGVGNNDKAGKMSPRNLWSTTITDELRLSNNFESKVIGISLKDRGAILPAGHSANAAYWYDDKTGKWITSNYYMQQLPTWVNNFNEKDYVTSMMAKDWNTLLPINNYTQSTTDDKPYEADLPGTKSHAFPYELSSISTKEKYNTFKFTPYASTFTFNFAKEAIINEKLGKGAVVDFLTISISSTDYMGHTFGANAVETQDTYLRLDKDIADFLANLDLTFGKDNYLVFLTADHGAAHIPAFLAEHKIPAGVFSESILAKDLNKIIEDSLGIKKAISSLQNYQVYIDFNAIQLQGKSISLVKEIITQALKSKPFITNVFETEKITTTALPEPIKSRLINGYAPTRSGDIQFVIKPGFFDGTNKGTTHGLWNPYDSHIPLIFYGWKIKPGNTYRETYMTDIAPTIAALLQIQMPSACVGKVLEEVLIK
ncbi:MAG: alkaline phosphatase PafA [Ferruginibacter sp.]|nr:alkaline phosphatase family protein [Ferruginibacter sp.]